MSMLNDTDLQPNQVTYLARLDRAVDRLTNLVREAQYYFEVESLSNTDCTTSLFYSHHTIANTFIYYSCALPSRPAARGGHQLHIYSHAPRGTRRGRNLYRRRHSAYVSTGRLLPPQEHPPPSSDQRYQGHCTG